MGQLAPGLYPVLSGGCVLHVSRDRRYSQHPGVGPKAVSAMQEKHMRKLFTLVAVGAMVAAMIPATVSAAGNSEGKTSGVDVVVDTGTTVYAPATIHLTTDAGSGDPGAYKAGTTNAIPGQTFGNTAVIEWMSNESSKGIYITLSTALTGGVGAKVISPTDVSLQDTAPSWHAFADTSTALWIKNITGVRYGATYALDTRETATFGLRVFIPATVADTYTGVVTFTVGVGI